MHTGKYNCYFLHFFYILYGKAIYGELTDKVFIVQKNDFDQQTV